MGTIATGLNADQIGHIVAAQGRLYYLNDYDSIKVWTPPATAMVTAGIAAPASGIGAPTVGGASITAGTHLVRYRYKNSFTGYVSEPSVAVEYTSAGSEQWTFSVSAGGGGGDVIRSTDSKVDTIVIEMTAAGGTAYYIESDTLQTASTIVVTNSDSTLIVKNQSAVAFGTGGHEVPPLALFGAEHKGRLFLAGTTTRTGACGVTNASTSVTGTGFSTLWAGRTIVFGSETVRYRIVSSDATTITLERNYSGTTGANTFTITSRQPSRVYWSSVGFPEGFNLTAQARDMLQNNSDELSGIASYQGSLWVFGQHTMERLLYSEDPALGDRVALPTTHGLWNYRCLVECEGELFGFGRGGVWALSSGFPRHISKPIDESWQAIIDKTDYQYFHGCYDPQERVVRWWFVKGSDTYPEIALRYEIDTGEWGLDEYKVGITCSRVIPDSDGNVYCMVGDENGYTWFLGLADTDGVPANNQQIVTVSAASGTTITVDETISDTVASVDGCSIYNPTLDEWRYVASHTSSVITLSSAFSADPSVGAELYLGFIPFYFQTKWFVGQGLQDKKSPLFFIIELYPGTSGGQLRVEIFKDFSTAPVAWETLSSDLFCDGITVRSRDILVDLSAGSGDGFIAVPLGSDFYRAFKAKVSSFKPGGDIRILGAYFSSSPTKQVLDE